MLWYLLIALAVAAGTALAVTTLVPSGHPGAEGSRHPGIPLANAQLAAWKVVKQANGDIDVTINQLKNPVGLQSKLRADGLPVRVSYSSHPLVGIRRIECPNRRQRHNGN